MKHYVIIFLALISFCNPAIPQDTQSVKQNRILRNWAAAQVGEIAGQAFTIFMLYSLEELNIMKYSSNDEKNKTVIISTIVVGNLIGNFLLKKETQQSNMFFLKNILFSSIPVITYSVLVKPDLTLEDTSTRNIKATTGLILVSLFVTPLFATLGNEIFNRQQSRSSPEMGLGVQPYISTVNKDYRLGFVLRF